MTLSLVAICFRPFVVITVRGGLGLLANELNELVMCDCVTVDAAVDCCCIDDDGDFDVFVLLS
jgi:hypothetical protein